MKTGCTDELIHQIADVTAFSKMRIAKSAPDAKARYLIKTVCVCRICCNILDLSYFPKT